MEFGYLKSRGNRLANIQPFTLQVSIKPIAVTRTVI